MNDINLKCGYLDTPKGQIHYAEDRERRKTRPPIDEVQSKEDGFHLTELWQRRHPFYPKNRPDLLRRFVLDALKVWDRVEEGLKAMKDHVAFTAQTGNP